jgi:hypothetical protein
MLSDVHRKEAMNNSAGPDWRIGFKEFWENVEDD